MQSFIIKDAVFQTEVLFVVNCSMVDFFKKVKRYEIERPKAIEYYYGMVIVAGKRFCRIVWLKDFTKKNEYLAQLSHELFHLVVRICGDKGIPIVANIENGECGDEPAAYLMEFYVKECLAQLKGAKNE